MAKRHRVTHTLAVIADVRVRPGVAATRTRRLDRIRYLLRMANVEILEETSAPNSNGPVAFVLGAADVQSLDAALYGESGITYSIREPRA